MVQKGVEGRSSLCFSSSQQALEYSRSSILATSNSAAAAPKAHPPSQPSLSSNCSNPHTPASPWSPSSSSPTQPPPQHLRLAARYVAKDLASDERRSKGVLQREVARVGKSRWGEAVGFWERNGGEGKGSTSEPGSSKRGERGRIKQEQRSESFSSRTRLPRSGNEQ